MTKTFQIQYIMVQYLKKKKLLKTFAKWILTIIIGLKRCIKKKMRSGSTLFSSPHTNNIQTMEFLYNNKEMKHLWFSIKCHILVNCVSIIENMELIPFTQLLAKPWQITTAQNDVHKFFTIQLSSKQHPINKLVTEYHNVDWFNMHYCTPVSIHIFSYPLYLLAKL